MQVMYESMNFTNSTNGASANGYEEIATVSVVVAGFISTRLYNYLRNKMHRPVTPNEDRLSCPFLDLLIEKKELLTQINTYEGCVIELEEKQLASTLDHNELENHNQLQAKLNESYLKLGKCNTAIQDHLDSESSMPNLNAFSDVIEHIKTLQEQNRELKHLKLNISQRQDKLIEKQVSTLETLNKNLRFFSQPTDSNNNSDSNKAGLTL